MHFNSGALFLILILPTLILAENTYDDTKKTLDNENKIIKYKLRSIPAILIVSTISSCIPILANKVPKLRPTTKAYLKIKVLAAGLIFATGLALMFPDLFKSLGWITNDIFTFDLNSPIAATLIRSVDAFAESFYISISPLIIAFAIYYLFQDLHWSNVPMMKYIMPVQGVVYSLNLGISIGLITNLRMANVLLAILLLHLYSDGIVVGEFIITFNEFSRQWTQNALLYSTLLAAPVGIEIGIRISTIFYYDQGKCRMQMLDGALVWMLVCMAMVEFSALVYVMASRVRVKVVVGAGFTIIFTIWFNSWCQ